MIHCIIYSGPRSSFPLFYRPTATTTKYPVPYSNTRDTTITSKRGSVKKLESEADLSLHQKMMVCVDSFPGIIQE